MALGDCQEGSRPGGRLSRWPVGSRRRSRGSCPGTALTGGAGRETGRPAGGDSRGRRLMSRSRHCTSRMGRRVDQEASRRRSMGRCPGGQQEAIPGEGG